MKRIFMRYKNGKDKAFTLSYDDGVQQDKLFIELIKKYGCKATFNLNSARFITKDFVYPEGKIWRAMIDEEVVPTYDPAFCEIACHSAHHPTLLNATAAAIADELLSDKKTLENMFGKIVTGLAIPNGPYDDLTIAVSKMCGFKYARTISSSNSIQLPASFMPLNPTCSHSDAKLFELADSFISTEVKENPLFFYVWGHTYTLEENNTWDEIEKLLKMVSFLPNVWYATNGEIVDYIEKFNSLEFSALGNIVHNPTDIEIWFKCDGNINSVKPSETIRL